MTDKTVTVNRKATHDYHILRTLEAGLSLLGTEIKSVRAGHVSIEKPMSVPRATSSGWWAAHRALRARQPHQPRPHA
jgi:tmRNA-binding protein